MIDMMLRYLNVCYKMLFDLLEFIKKIAKEKNII